MMLFDIEAFKRLAANPKRNDGGDWYSCHCGDDMDEAAAEIERLQAIVDRLPKTKDGVVVIPAECSVWYLHGESVIELDIWSTSLHVCSGLDMDQQPYIRVSRDREYDTHIAVSDCYSTKEAALAALQGKDS